MRLVIIEDNPLLLQNLTLLLSGEPGITVAGTYKTGEDALAGIKESSPELALVDLGLPGMSGIEFIRGAKATMPELDMMAYTVFEDRETIFSAIKAGASGYILKGCTPRELIEALFSLHQGGAPMSPKIARAVIKEFQGEDPTEQFLLSPREKQILGSLEKGLTYKEIADEFALSHHTVHTHIKNIYEKLQAKNKQEAFLKARRKALL
ncbi:MAG: DNA-binding response regulator [Deltaproteobacteria bacterium]|nr:MAG: DNA-binding response regulator [Deltaproteobacteria bacterium]